MRKLLNISGLTAAQNALATVEALDVDVDTIRRELNERLQRKRRRIEAQMARAAKARGTTRLLRSRSGDGGMVDLHVHPDSFHYWGQRLGYECWDDPQFVAEYKRDNPASRPQTRSGRLTMTMPAMPRIRGRRGRWAL